MFKSFCSPSYYTHPIRYNNNRNLFQFKEMQYCHCCLDIFLNRITRIWNTLTLTFHATFRLGILYKCYVYALEHNYDPQNPRFWKTICLSCIMFHLKYSPYFVVVCNRDM